MIFDMFDFKHDGNMSFKKFIQFYKLSWTFILIDTNKHNYISTIELEA